MPFFLQLFKITIFINNLILSKKRAEAVRRELEDMGIDPRKIQVYYYGEWKPIRRNVTDFDKQYNRRVEIRVMR